MKAPKLPQLSGYDDLNKYDRDLNTALWLQFREVQTALDKGKPYICVSGHSGPSQSMTVNGTDVIQWNNVLVDTHTYFSTTTYRCTPRVPGYWLTGFSLACNASAWGAGTITTQVRKNGTAAVSAYVNTNALPNPDSLASSGMVYLNGSTDYLDMVVTNTGSPTSPSVSSSPTYQWWMQYLST